MLTGAVAILLSWPPPERTDPVDAVAPPPAGPVSARSPGPRLDGLPQVNYPAETDLGVIRCTRAEAEKFKVPWREEWLDVTREEG